MAVFSDMNGFPEGGFPVLANDNDMISLNNLYWNPLKLSGFIVDVNGAVRLGAVTCGAITAAGVAAGGAISGATTIAANNTVTLSHDTSPLTISGTNAILSITGWNASIGTLLQRVRRAFFTDLEVKNTPTVDGEPVALIRDLTSKQDKFVTKTTTGDGVGSEGIMQINTFDKTIKVYADGGWRQLTTW
jgi:hypothetical protein